MILTIVSMWYNEEDLAPFFLEHYKEVDKIIILLDTDTTDNTRQICENYKNVEVKDFTFPNMYDNYVKTNRINEESKTIEADWVIGLDSDEFIFAPKEYRGAREFLDSLDKYTVVCSEIYQVYRHISESDLDIKKPPIFQRQYGDPSLTSWFNAHYVKPDVVRGKMDILWGLGFHECNRRDIKIAPIRFHGAHWMMADVDIAIKRRIYGRKMRYNRRNIQDGLGSHNHNITEEIIREECQKHLNDPNVLTELLPKEIRF